MTDEISLHLLLLVDGMAMRMLSATILSTMCWTQKSCQTRGPLTLCQILFLPIESEAERSAREQDEIAIFDDVGDCEADATVILEDAP